MTVTVGLGVIVLVFVGRGVCVKVAVGGIAIAVCVKAASAVFTITVSRGSEGAPARGDGAKNGEIQPKIASREIARLDQVRIVFDTFFVIIGSPFFTIYCTVNSRRSLQKDFLPTLNVQVAPYSPGFLGAVSGTLIETVPLDGTFLGRS